MKIWYSAEYWVRIQNSVPVPVQTNLNFKILYPVPAQPNLNFKILYSVPVQPNSNLQVDVHSLQPEGSSTKKEFSKVS